MSTANQNHFTFTKWTADLQYVTSCGRTYIMKKLWAASVVQNGVDYEIC